MLFLLLLSSIALVIEPGLLPTQIGWGTSLAIPLPPWFAFPFVVVAMTGFVNAVNMADGQDGIATGMFVIWSMCLCLHTGETTQGVAVVLLTTGLIAFAFNVAGRAFLGDSGAYGVSFIVGLLAILAHNHWGVRAETITVWFFIPVIDCLRLLFWRARNGRRPFFGGRDHFHHRLDKRVGKTVALVLYLGVIGATSLTATLVPSLSVICLLLLAIFYLVFVRRRAEPSGRDLEKDFAGEFVRARLKDIDHAISGKIKRREPAE